MSQRRTASITSVACLANDTVHCIHRILRAARCEDAKPMPRWWQPPSATKTSIGFACTSSVSSRSVRTGFRIWSRRPFRGGCGRGRAGAQDRRSANAPERENCTLIPVLTPVLRLLKYSTTPDGEPQANMRKVAYEKRRKTAEKWVKVPFPQSRTSARPWTSRANEQRGLSRAKKGSGLGLSGRRQLNVRNRVRALCNSRKAG